MESVGHSRLLRFLINQNKLNKMEAPVFKIEFEYITPTNIESEVPGKHEIREGDAPVIDTRNSTLALDDMVENPEDYVLSPVITVTKQESEFTKGDLKLQKVSVTENISEEKDVINGIVYYTINSNPNIHADVIEGPQPVRIPDKDDRKDPPPVKVADDDAKTKTRIPTLKFKQAAQAVRDRRGSDDKKDEVPPPRLMQKRSSIPRLKDSRIPPPLGRQVSKSEIKAETPQPEDEFEKIYDEIIVSEPKEIVVETIENIKVEDLEKLENKFEEIIHDYEENKVHPITDDIPVNVEKPKSKIPLSKRKSEQEIEIPKPVERTSIKKDEPKPEKQVVLSSRIPMHKDIPHKPVRTKYNVPRKEEKSNDVTSNKIVITKQVSVEKPKEIDLKPKNISIQPENPKKIDLKPKDISIRLEKPKEIDLKPKDISIQPEKSKEIDLKPKGISLQPEKPKKIDLKPKDIRILPEKPKEIDLKPKDISIQPEKQKGIDLEPKNISIQPEKPKEIDLKSKDISLQLEKPKEIDLKPKDISIEPVEVVKREVIEVKMKESVVQEVSKPKPKPRDESEEKPNVTSINTAVDFCRKPSVRSETSQKPIIENTTISRLNDINKGSKQVKQDNNNDIDKTYTPEHEIENNIDSNENEKNSIDQEYTPGKVSRLLQRIRSNEFGTSDSEPKKEIPIDVTKKRSVLSKIAMFERQESKEAPTTRLPRSNNKLTIKPKEIQVETMKEEVIDRIPVIVDELLKEDNLDPVNEVKVEYLPEHPEESINKDYKVEIKEDKVQYHEIQIVNPVQEIKIKNFKEESPVTNGQIVLDKPIEDNKRSKDSSDNKPKRNKFEPYDIPKKEQIPKPITREFLQPPTPNIDEKVPREIFIETLEYKPTEYEIKAQVSVEKKPLIGSIQNNTPHKLQNKPYNNNDKEESPIESISLQETKIETLEFAPIAHSNQVENPDDVFTKESTVEKWRKLNENEQNKKERPKSVAELDLGDVVKGKVHQMIVRMNSFEKTENNKKEIDRREQPRKKSVSKIIALFEQKSIQFEAPTTYKPDVTTKLPTPPKTLSEEEYQGRIAELVNGKLVYGRVENMTYIVLNNRVEMPVLAVGTALLDQRLIRPIIEAAIDMGYRAIDTAYIYGNEKEIGEAIRAKIDDGTVAREDLFIISKLWSTFHRSDLVSKACNASLRAMGLDYFDLYLIHNPVSFKEGSDPIPKIANVVQYSSSDYMDAWFGMEGLVTKGLVKSIGMSNFNSRQIQTVVDKARVKPVINQVECHPYLSQDRLDEFCSVRDIKLSCFGVLGSKGTPSEYKSSLPPIIDDPLVQVMAAGLNITPAQLLIRYQVDRGHNVVVKASSAAHLWDNLQALQVSLDLAQVEALNALNKNKRMFTFVGIGDTHRNYPFKIPF